MPSFTVETIERADFSSILKALDEKRKAERLLEAQSKALGVAEKDLRVVLNAQERAFQVAAMGAQTATTSTGAMTAATANLRSQLFDVATGLQGGMNPFTILSQQGPQIAEVFLNNSEMAAKLAAVLPTVGVAAGGVVAAGGPLLLWHQALSERNRIAKDELDAVSDSLKRMGAAAKKIGEEEAKLSTREGVLAGTVSKDATREIDAQAKATETYGEMISSLRSQLGALQKTKAELEARRGSWTNLFDLSQIFGGRDLEQQIGDVGAAITNTQGQIKEMTDASSKFATKTAEVVKGEEDAAKATKKRMTALEEAGLARETAFLNDQQIMEEWNDWQKEDNETFAKTLAARQKAYEKAGQDREDQIAADQERMRKYYEELEKMRVEELNKAARAFDTFGSISDSLGSVVDQVLEKRTDAAQELQSAYEQALEDGDTATANSLKRRLDAEKQAAMRAWHLQQAAAYATALAMAAQGVSVAAASYPPPANIPAILTAAATGVANVAAVAATPPPEFDDTPGVMRADSDGKRVGATFKSGDYMAAAQNPADLIRQVLEPLVGNRQRRSYDSPTSVRSTIYIGAKQAAAIEAQASVGRRGTAKGTRPLGRRVASTGGAG